MSDAPRTLWDKIIDNLMSFLLGGMCASAVSVFFVGRKLELIEYRVGKLEQSLSDVTRVTLRNPEQERTYIK